MYPSEELYTSDHPGIHGDVVCTHTYSFLSSITAARSSVTAHALEETRDALRVKQTPHTMTEILTCPSGTYLPLRAGKLYLDRDVYLGALAPTQEKLEELLKEVRDNVYAILERLSIVGNSLSVKIATRHGWCPKRQEHKASFRPFIQGMTIPYTGIPYVIRFMGQEDFWDMSVYKSSEQLLASINGCKGLKGDTRVLKPQSLDDDPLLYVVQHVEAGWPLLDLPPELCGAEKTGEEAYITDITEITDKQSKSSTDHVRASPAFVRGLVSCLSKQTASDRTKWLAIAMVLKAEGGGSDEYLNVFLKFSESGSTFKSTQDCEQTWKSIQVGGRDKVVKMGTLVLHAMLDDPVAYKAVRQEDNTRKRALHKSLMDAGHNKASNTSSEVNSAHASTSSGALVLSAMQRICPERFELLRADCFTAESCENKQVKLLESAQDFRATMTLPDCSIRLEGEDVPLCSLAGNFKMKNLGRIDRNISDETEFAFSRMVSGTSDKTEIRATEANGNLTSVTVYDVFSNDPQFRHLCVRGKDKNVTHAMGRDLAKQILEQASKHVIDALGPGAAVLFNIGTLNMNLNTVNQINITNAAPPEKPSDFSKVRVKLEAAGVHQKLRKGGGNVYEPIEGCPCAFTVRGTYEEFINSVLKGDEVFKDNPKRFDDLMSFLTKYEMDEMPWFKPDLDLLSFSNGVLQLASGTFTLYEGMDTEIEGGLVSRVARHHIPYPYTGCGDTPLLDVILTSQFDADVAHILCALFGRTFFNVGQLDSWQVMPFLVGIGGTGKSLLLKILEQLFAQGSVGSLAAKREEVFGMANLVDKELVMGRDMPAKMSASLPQETMQAMTAGEGMEVPRKGQVAMMKRWTAPVIMAGNHMPDYVNTGNNVGRRMVSIRFDNVITNPQEDLEERILAEELPNIIHRFLTSYTRLRIEVSVAKGFWKVVPAIMLEWRGKLTAATNKLEEFLAMDEETRSYTIKYVPGAITWALDFKYAFEDKMKPDKYVEDPAVFATHGFSMPVKKEMMCKHCKGRALTGCCPQWTREATGRGMKQLIHNMELMPYTSIPMDDLA